jgi:type II secretory pathway component PulF
MKAIPSNLRDLVERSIDQFLVYFNAWLRFIGDLSADASISRKHRPVKLNATRRLNLYNALSNETSRGIPLHSVLDAMHRNLVQRHARRGEEPTSIKRHVVSNYAKALRAWVRGMSDGKRLGNAMRGWVPVSECRLILAGEMMEKLSVTFTEISGTIKQRGRITTAIAKGCTYPLLLAFVATLALGIMGGYVIPRLQMSIPPEKWVGAAYLLSLVSQAVVYGWWLAVIAIVTLIVTIRWALPNWVTPMRKRFESWPPFSFYRFHESVNFMLALQVLSQTGMRIEAALSTISQDSSPYLKQRVDAIRQQVAAGQPFAKALDATGYNFPDSEIIQSFLLQTSGTNLGAMLKESADRWSNQLVEKVEQQSLYLLLGGILAIGVVAGTILIGLFGIVSGMTDINPIG